MAGSELPDGCDVVASFPTRCRSSRISCPCLCGDVSACCCGTGQLNIAFQMFLQLQTLRRHVSRPVAAGVSLSLSGHRGVLRLPSCEQQFVECDTRGCVTKSYLIHLRTHDQFARFPWARGFLLRKCLPLSVLPVVQCSLSTALRVGQFRRRLFSVARRVTPNLFVDKGDSLTSRITDGLSPRRIFIATFASMERLCKGSKGSSPECRVQKSDGA